MGKDLTSLKAKKNTMKTLVFATNNAHKLEEVAAMISDKFEIKSLKDIHCDVDIPEDGNTLEANALIKARYIHQRYHTDCFADDTGLEIDALEGAPGVYTARYGAMDPNAPSNTQSHDSNANMTRVLKELIDVPTEKRTARFRTVICLILDNKEYLFEGVVEGKIAREKRGYGGFGYDPLFVPDGYDKTFAEMNPDEKNRISHRGRAVEKLVHYLISV